MIDRTTQTRIGNIMPFLESVTYSNRTSADTFSSTTVARARRKKIDKEDRDFSKEILVSADLIWQLLANYLVTNLNNAITPKVDDYLVDGSGVKWVVKGVVAQMNGTVFNMACRRGV